MIQQLDNHAHKLQHKRELLTLINYILVKIQRIVGASLFANKITCAKKYMHITMASYIQKINTSIMNLQA